MKRFLALISLLFTFAVVSAQKFVISFPDSIMKYNVTIDFRKANITGICILKFDADGEIKGAIVNEFGIHAMNFTVSADRQNVKLVDVISFMDKWYIKKVVRGDLQYLFSATTDTLGKEQGRRKVERQDDKSITMSNLKYDITYNFCYINDAGDETTE